MKESLFSELTDLQLLVLCVWREARGEPSVAQLGVCWVVLNRVTNCGWWGNSIRSVILQPWQFSSFNLSDPNHDQWPEEHEELALTALCQAALDGNNPDPTNGATFYHSFPTALDERVVWAKDMILLEKLGNIYFFRRPI